MKISVVVDNDLNSDIRVLRELRVLAGNGYDISVLCFDFGRYKTSPLDGIIVERVPLRRRIKDIMFFLLNSIPFYDWMWIRLITRHLRNHEPCFLHVHDLYMARAASLAVKRYGRPVSLVLDLHENYPFQVTTYNWTKGFLRKLISRPQIWKKKESSYLNLADTIIVLSSEYRDSLVNEYPELSRKKFVVFPNVPDITSPEYTNKTKIATPFANNYPIMLYYGIIAERRGIFETLEVFRRLVKDNHEVNLLLIGPADKKDRPYFEKMIADPVLKGRLLHIPWINASDFPGFLDLSDICLAPFRKNPQHESGVANKIYDYMLGGKPLIVSDCLPQMKLIEKYTCGLVFRTMQQYYEASVSLLKDPVLRKSLGINGRTAILNFHNIAIFREELISVYSRNS